MFDKISSMSVTYAEVDVQRIFDLRYNVLRPGRPMSEAQFVGDVDARHFAVLDLDLDLDLGGENQVVCCLTMIQAPYQYPEGEQMSAWQLRGMATAASHRGRGLGKKLLLYMESALFPDGRDCLLWCHAREAVIEFYRSCGWLIDSDIFEIPNMPSVGLHYRMIKRVGA